MAHRSYADKYNESARMSLSQGGDRPSLTMLTKMRMMVIMMMMTMTMTMVSSSQHGATGTAFPVTVAMTVTMSKMSSSLSVGSRCSRNCLNEKEAEQPARLR